MERDAAIQPLATPGQLRAALPALATMIDDPDVAVHVTVESAKAESAWLRSHPPTTSGPSSCECMGGPSTLAPRPQLGGLARQLVSAGVFFQPHAPVASRSQVAVR